MIWGVICKNWLRIGFSNEFLIFTSENEVDLDELHILKITFKNGLGIAMGGFPQDFPQNFAQDSLQDSPARFPAEFPTRFPTEFPARFSCKISHRISHKISQRI